LPHGSAFIPYDWIVTARPEGIPSQQVSAAVVLNGDPIVIVDEVGGDRAARRLVETPERIVAERRVVCATCRSQMIL
jgi:hypothetical protein